MTTIEVLDETGRARKLADQIDGILHRTLPTVRDISCMTPPAAIRFRLLTPRALRREVRAYAARKVVDSFARSAPSPQELAEGQRLQTLYRASMALGWIMLNARTVTDPVGEPQTLIAPRALHHTGVRYQPGALYQLVVHESAHQWQMATSQGAVMPLPFLPRDLDTPERASAQLIEGHADWVAQQTARRLLDDVPEEAGPLRRSWRYRRQDDLIHRLASKAATSTESPALPGGLEQIGQVFHREGLRFVEAAVEALGVEGFNRIWHTPDLVPLREELTGPGPERWFSRVQA